MIGISLDELDTSDLSRGKYWKPHSTRGFSIRMAYIYVLVNPLDKTICYVRTKQPTKRLYEHINDNYQLMKRFRECNPVMRIIERTDIQAAKERERVNINRFLRMGFSLSNIVTGKPYGNSWDVFPRFPYDILYDQELTEDYSI